MKAWLGAAGRLCADFILVLILIATLSVLSHSPEAGSLGWIVAALGQSVLRDYPLAACVAMGLGFYAFEGRLGRKHRLITWVSVVVLGFGLLAGSTALRRLFLESLPEAGPTISEALPQAGAVMERNEGGVFISELGKEGALGVISYESARPPLRRLAYNSQAPLAKIEEVPKEVAHSGELHTDELRAWSFGQTTLLRRLSDLDRLSYPWDLALLGGFALLAAGLGGFSRLPRWPLVGLFFGAGALIGLCYLDGALSSPELKALLASSLGKVLPGSLDWQLWVAACEAILGALVAALTLPSWGRSE